MPFIGNQPADKFLTLEKQVFTTSATATYTLDREVSSVNDIELFLNNVRQEPTTAYTISGTTLTLASAITSSDSMYCVYQGRAVGTVAPTLPITNFSSTGIDDNATSTAITIESGGDIGIGTTNPDGSDFGSGTGILHLKDMGSNNTGIKIEDGTTKYVAIVNGGGDAYTGTWSNNNYRFYTNSTERMRINNSGQVIIGGTSAENSSVIFEAKGATNPIIQVEDTTNNIRCGIQAGDTDAVIRCPQDNDLAFVVGASEPERMRIQSNGRALFSTTGTNSVLNSSWKFQMRFDGGSDAGLFMASEANANGTGFIQFNRSSTTSIGNIVRNGTNDSVNYNTTSDYRMKENVIDLSDATTRVKQLQPKRFSWISQESDTPTVDGFLAHEVSSVVPEAITGTKDEVDADGNPKYQGIDQSKLVPLLTASLKEAIAKIEELETRIATLEGN